MMKSSFGVSWVLWRLMVLCVVCPFSRVKRKVFILTWMPLMILRMFRSSVMSPVGGGVAFRFPTKGSVVVFVASGSSGMVLSKV